MNTIKTLVVILVVMLMAGTGIPASVANTQAAYPGTSAGLWYVSPGGSDASSCASPAEPCATINAAIGKAAPGDTVYVAEGTYTGEGEQVVTIDKTIILSGGWDEVFTSQVGLSTVDGGEQRTGILVSGPITSTIA